MNRDIILKARIFEQISRDRGMEIFEQLSPHCLDLKKREILFRDGEKVEQFAIVEYGELSATKLYQDGRQSLLLKFLPSYMVGVDIAATKKQICTYYVTAQQDCRVYLIDYEKVAKPGWIPEPERLLMMESVLALIAGEHLRQMNKIEILSRNGLRERILTFLAIQRNLRDSDEFDILYNREELAEYLCVNRSALSHELRKMEQEHLIFCRKNHFRILDAELYRRCEETVEI